MSFVDFVRIHIRAGHGGPGAVAFRKEKFAEYGGPAGGNGGAGGSVIVIADGNVGTLLDFRFKKEVFASKGRPGGGGRRDGKSAQNIELRVPVGTIVRNSESLELIADLDTAGKKVIIARGGKGGLGNSNFNTSTNQAPRYAQKGLPGDELHVVFELKLLADIGIIGYPSVGKSTLISVISNARPKIADYHFTTLAPNLGIVLWRDHKSFVVADIPGLIEGAHEGHGLGHQFLRHVERCRALLHVVEVTMPFEGVDDGRDPIADFEKIQNELARFSDALAERPQIVALSKADLPWVREREPELRQYFESRGYTFITFSAVTREALTELKDLLGQLIDVTPAPDFDLFTQPEAFVPEPDDEETYDPNEDEQFAALRRLIQDEDALIDAHNKE